MHAPTLLRLGAATSLGVAIALAAPAVASAHVSVEPSDATPGAYSVLTFAVGHGCDGSATTSVEIALPDDVGHATATVNPGWTVESSHDDPQTITYTAIDPLPDGVRDTFEVALTLPEGTPGDTVAFPVTQRCEEGQIDWVELPEADGSEPESPAPIVTLEPIDSGEALVQEQPATDDGAARFLGGAALVAALAAAGLAAFAVRRASGARGEAGSGRD